MNIAQFQRDVLYWYDHHGRKDLPWQQDKNHYRVWLSEIMLQQTQVSTVIDYYLRFLERYPSVEDLANAPQDEVMALWSGLGYYARARNLHKTAQIVAFQLNGQFPQTLEGICALPGIGRSTGSAILALTDNQALPILDGNVKRVLSRLFCEGDIDALWAHAERLVPAKQATPYTQAMMDLGAMICTRHNPKCLICPIQKHCMAFKESRIAEFPLKQNRPQKDSKIEYFLLAYFQNQIFLERRDNSGIWGGLWSLPTLEGDTLDFLDHPKAVLWPERQHVFTHFRLHFTPVILKLAAPELPWKGAWHEVETVLNLGLPKPIKTLIQDFLENAHGPANCALSQT